MAKRFRCLSMAVCAAGLLSMQGLGSSLTLTSAGVADGFTLSTFATTNPGGTSCCSGPFGVAVAPGGNVIVNTGAGTRYVFADTDGQTVASALFTATSTSGTSAYATAGGQAYGVQSGVYVQFKPDGTVDHALSGVKYGPFLGMWGNPVNGHIIAQSTSGLIEIDPLANGGTGSSRLFAAVIGDGVTVSQDGKTAYLAIGGQVIGYDIATGAQTFNSGSFAGLSGPDGTGVISSSNALNGDLIVNFNGNGFNTGGIGLLDPTTLAFTIIASGGTRGDYVAPDTTNGSLFLDYSDTVERLACGPTCAIGSAPPPAVTPEPGTFVLLGTGLTWMGAMVRRRRA